MRSIITLIAVALALGIATESNAGFRARREARQERRASMFGDCRTNGSCQAAAAPACSGGMCRLR